MIRALMIAISTVILASCTHFNKEPTTRPDPIAGDYGTDSLSVPQQVDLSDIDIDQAVGGFIVLQPDEDEDQYRIVSFGNVKRGYVPMSKDDFLEKVNNPEKAEKPKVLDISVFAATLVTYSGSHCGWMGVAGDSGWGGCH